MELSSPVSAVKGVGDKTSKLLNKTGVYSVMDILCSFPRGYVTYPEPVKDGLFEVGKPCAIKATVTKQPVLKRGRIPVTLSEASDGFSRIDLLWFRMPYLTKTLKKGMTYVFYGVISSKGESFAMEQPRIFSCEDYVNLQQNMHPVYPLTEGLKNYMVERAVRNVLAESLFPEELLPHEMIDKYGFTPIDEAYRNMHFPPCADDLEKARERFAYEEFLVFLVAMRYQNSANKQIPNSMKITGFDMAERVIESLPYELTGAQKQTIEDIKADITSPHIMQRLVQGDVGSGKTIVAFVAMIILAQNGYQSAMMAPTEVLAGQHYAKLKEIIVENNLPFEAVLLTGSMKAAEKREVRYKISSGEPVLAVGTHALIQEGVDFSNLGLVITDEQHRFGVRQRDALWDKGITPHILVMSATPIPRTLSLILYGDLAVSLMKDVPARRIPIKSCIIGEDEKMTALQLMCQQVRKGKKAYCVCPLVSEGMDPSVKDVETYTDYLRNILPDDIKIDSLDGRMKPEKKDEVMEEFRSGDTDVLVSTTVIEVGVDVPEATFIMIENAERFGLSQLHQLRGRVGRGADQSYCILVNGSDSDRSVKRLEVIKNSNDGFHIAAEDLKMRGPGEYFGVRQSGEKLFEIGDIYRDEQLLKGASNDADLILNEDPELTGHPALRERVLNYMNERRETAGL
ncbi:MAG: ATP-dependent DNA helicase RecG [Eubacterium sp.]|nr:ATP-dependent DNA helicase RecG [Eubacterium sp.]